MQRVYSNPTECQFCRRFSNTNILLGSMAGPVTYLPVSFTLRSLVPRFETSTPGSNIGQVPRYPQSREMSTSLDLELQYPWTQIDQSIVEDFGKTLKWAAPQARSLAFRMHLVDSPNMSTKDGPAILQFKAHCIKLSLSRDRDNVAAPTGRAKADSERCKVVPLLNMSTSALGSYGMYRFWTSWG